MNLTLCQFYSCFVGIVKNFSFVWLAMPQRPWICRTQFAGTAPSYVFKCNLATVINSYILLHAHHRLHTALWTTSFSHNRNWCNTISWFSLIQQNLSLLYKHLLQSDATQSPALPQSSDTIWCNSLLTSAFWYNLIQHSLYPPPKPFSYNLLQHNPIIQSEATEPSPSMTAFSYSLI